MSFRLANVDFLLGVRKSRSSKMPLGALQPPRAGLDSGKSFGEGGELSYVLEHEYDLGDIRLVRESIFNGHRCLDFDAGGLDRICVSVTEESMDQGLKLIEEGSSPRLHLPGIITTKLGEKEVCRLDASGVEKHILVLKCCSGKSWKDARPKNSQLFESLGNALGEVCNANLGTAPCEKGSEQNGVSENLEGNFFLKNTALNGSRYDQATDAALRRFAELEGLVPSNFCSTIGFASSNAFSIGGNGGLGVVGLSHVCDVVQCNTTQALAMLVSEVILFKPDVLDAACCVVKGFHGSCRLQENELIHLYALVGAALGSRVLSRKDDRNLAKKALLKWNDISPSICHYSFRHACNLEPCPQRHEFNTWVGQNRHTFASIFDFDLNSEPRMVFDYSVEGIPLKYLECMDNPDISVRHVKADMIREGCRYGVGRYLEPRLVYTSEAYMTKGNERPVARTVHLGIDLFVEAGTSVRTPVAGTIHSFQDNALDRDYGPTVVLEHQVSRGLTFYSLFGHLSRESLQGKEVGMKVNAGEVIGWVGSMQVNGGWAPHVHFQLMMDMCDCQGDFVGAANPHMKQLYESLCPNPNSLLRMEGGDLDFNFSSGEDLFAKRQELLGNHQIMLFGSEPLRLVRGYMQYLYDEEGRHFLDMYNNVQHVGHQNPKVVRAGQQQMERLNVNSRYLNDYLMDCAKELVSTMPGDLQVCYFVNSGSEANELALRLASCYTGRRDVLVVEGGYHGNSSACAAMSSYKFDKPGGPGAEDWVHVIPMPDSYRGVYRGDGCGPKYVEKARSILKELEKSGNLPCGFICEGILSCAGQVIPPAGFLQGVYDAVRQHGGVCIADEVQTGFGRMGEHYWAFEIHGVVPDIVTLGKPIGNGHPIGAVVTTRKIADAFSRDTGYFNTFGGNPVSGRIALEVMKVIRQENLQGHAENMGLELKSGLCRLRETYEVVGDVRGIGLFWGVEFVTGKDCKPSKEFAHYMMNRLKDCGILVGVDGMQENVIKIKPPLVVTKANIATFLEAFETVLNEDFMQCHTRK